MNKFQIMDCTLRDGGYYTNWDFADDLVQGYVEACNKLPIDYIEVGYRSKPLEGYLGKFFYCPIDVLANIAQHSTKKLAIILNEKDVAPHDIESLLAPCTSLVTLVRIAVSPDHLSRAILLAGEIKKLGFEVSFNVMYMSTWMSKPEFLKELKKANGVCDFFYLVDSYGGIYPDELKQILSIVKENLNMPIGFHGHNNLELALINSLTAIDEGIDIVDATITGMGRGAGNLKTELLLTALNAKKDIDIDFNALGSIVDEFQQLQTLYNWGTSLPYMVSGANSLPQKVVMEWVGKRFFSFNSIIRALSNQSKGIVDNLSLSAFNANIFKKKARTALVIGGGPSAVNHADAINELIKNEKDLLVINASSKNALSFQSAIKQQVFCLVGNEGHRLERVFGKIDNLKGVCVLPPFPRKMGTYIPTDLVANSYELNEVSFTNKYQDSHTSLALQTAIELGIQKIYVAGYDGYGKEPISKKEQELFLENEYLFSAFKKKHFGLKSVTPTDYTELEPTSIYALL